MQDTNLIASDLRMCLMEGKLRYDFLNIYRGVQFVSPAELESVIGDHAVFSLQSSATVLIDRDKTSIVLSNGLMDPFIIRAADFDLRSGRLEVTDMAYAGDTVGNRHEHRVEIDPALPVVVQLADLRIAAEMIDISLSGAGLHLPTSIDETRLQRGQPITLQVQLPDGDLQIEAEILRYRKIFSHFWLAIKFTDVSVRKIAVLRYINQCLGDVRAEVQNMYQAALQRQAASKGELP